MCSSLSFGVGGVGVAAGTALTSPPDWLPHACTGTGRSAHAGVRTGARGTRTRNEEAKFVDGEDWASALGSRKNRNSRRGRCRVEPRLESDLDDAQYLFNKLYAVGVDYDDVVATLEREGIEKFVASFNELLKRVGDKRRTLAAAA
jgi:hypothetical protein